jgi:hypothetical protein
MLWFAGKQLQPEKKLADYLGRNENTRAVVKLQKKGTGPPAREPVGGGSRSCSLKVEGACNLQLNSWSDMWCADEQTISLLLAAT